ncbi:MAG: hypothetical protein HQL51_11405 [Magnetococcales bacterium]|nr:hypothetical protein [Magnetococcales bacterium]
MNGNPIFNQAAFGLIDYPLSGDDPVWDGRGWARLHNFVYEERLSPTREAAYYAHLALQAKTAEELFERHNRYVENLIYGATVPDTFLSANDKAHFPPLPDNQVLVRVENLTRWMQYKPEGGLVSTLREAFESFCELWKQSQGPSSSSSPDDVEKRRNAQAQLETWFDDWNRRRDARPMFAAFADEMAEELHENGRDGPLRHDWAERLRTRLGLAHLAPQNGVGVPVALMRYSTGVVNRAWKGMSKAGAVSAFALPTALDQTIWEYFFPAPPIEEPRLSFGRAMPLAPLDRLAAEVLHVKVPYQPSHMIGLAWLERPIPAYTVRDLRNSHLTVLQVETEQYDFGEEIPEEMP